MHSEKGPKYIYAKNISYIAIIITLEDIEKIWQQKMTTKQSEEYLFHRLCEKTAKNSNGFSILIGCFHRTII